MTKEFLLPSKREEIYELINDIAQKARLLEGGRGVIDSLIFLYRTHPNIPSNKIMARWTGIPVPALAALKGELIKAGILKDKRNFTRHGLDWLEKRLQMKWKPFPYPIDSTSFTDLSQAFIPWIELYPKALEFLSTKLRNALARRPKVDVTLDQAKATLETVMKRVALLLQFGDVEGLDILILGDDDALSLALCATNLPRSVTVVEVDERILDFLQSEYEKLEIKNTQLKLINADLREQLPTSLRGQHDIFFTDPPYTTTGIKTFFLRGLEGLNASSPWARGYVCTSRKPLTLHAFQEFVTKLGWHVSLQLPNFNRYEGNTRQGNASDLIRSDISKKEWKSLIPTQLPREKRFYTKDDLFCEEGL